MSSRSEPVKSPPPERLPIERDPIRWALQENNHDWYRELVEHSRDLLCVHDLQGRLLSVNPVPARLLGYSVDEMLQIPMREMIVPEYRDLFDLYLKQIEYDGEAEGLMVVLSRTGERQVWEFHNTLHSARMGPPVVLGLAHDITERRKAEAQFQALLEAAPDAMVVVDAEARMILVNAQVERMFGYQREELLGQRTEMLVPERLRDRHCELRNDFFRAPQNMPTRVAQEFLALHKDGHEFPVEINLSPLQTAEGLLVTSAIRDITERKQAEEALRISEREQHRITQQLETERARLIEAQAVAKVGSWETELPSLDITWSAQTHRIFETDPSYFHPRRPDFVELVHPEDRAKVNAAFRTSLEKGTPSTVEYRIVMADGRVKVLEEHWKVFQEGQGRPARLTGTCQDITERKQAEASLREVVEELRLAKEKLAEEKLYLEQEIDTELGFHEIVGQSTAMKNVMEQVGKVAASDATVLLLGETGTGKELVARALYRLSQRAGNSFIKMNCAAIPSGLLESELFGYEKGAFTGAVSKKVGRLELADKGTLFLDEIGEISLALQPKLLRVLQDQEFERLGGTQTLKVDFRLIAATNRDLAEGVKNGEFRSDLYYRLNVFPVRVPPLRERREDIRLLVEHFVQKFAKRMNKNITSIPKRTIDALVQWEWPGNVRELENFVERSVILTHGSVLVSPLSELKPPSEGVLSETLETAEREHILRALMESDGKIGGPRGAAARLGLKRTTLQSKLKQMGIDRRPSTAGR